jgi:EAL domain-containing protein (putative c-di-GMP-specific phosphodiesterase class I)
VQRAVLVGRGVPLLQGYLFGRPAPDDSSDRVPAPRTEQATPTRVV